MSDIKLRVFRGEEGEGELKEYEIELDDEEILNSGQENFTIVKMKILEIEWLYQYKYGHRRAKFSLNNK